MTAGRWVVLSGSDPGKGMSSETSARIFEPLFTTKDVGKGTGLGLSMVYGTLKQAGGFIFVDSEVDRGTTFRLYLPRATAAARTPETVAVTERGGNETVLAVEDNVGLRRVGVRQLNELGYRVLEAGDGNAAISIRESEPVECVYA